jgi:hypothetical protein
MIGYHKRWCTNHPWTSEAIETTFIVPIYNPDTGRQSRYAPHAGKMDNIATGPPGRVLVEHKTCSEDITAPDAPYWRRLAIDSQISQYMLAAWQKGIKITTCLYDVIRKPCIAPKKLGLKDAAKVLNQDTYLGQRISPETHHDFYHDTEKRETPEMFGIRLAQDCQTRPEWYFQRRLIQRTEKDLVETASQLWNTVKEIKNADKLKQFRRNDEACFAWGRPCEYFDLCTGVSDPRRWPKNPKRHPELEIADDQTAITHSALTTYATCPKKYEYRYIEGFQSEPSQALTFGTDMHAAIAAWWHTIDQARRHQAQQTSA